MAELENLHKQEVRQFEKVIVSACLLGEPCRYDGKSCPNPDVIAYVKDKIVFAVCPEVMGGLLTPRNSCEIVNDKVLSIHHEDCTKEYKAGAQQVLELAKREKIKMAILKSKSPSCGFGEVYDGSFKRKVVKGHGICAKMLFDNGINVVNSDKITFLSEKEDKKAL